MGFQQIRVSGEAGRTFDFDHVGGAVSLNLLLLFLFAAVRPVLGRRASIVLLKADVKYG